ncbi:MAG: arylesterase [Porticoccaceae bacterium]|nr:arylesterase [Porticoccaceae bacterium]
MLRHYSTITLAVCCLVFLSPQTQAAKLLILGDSLSAAYGFEERSGWGSLIKNHFQANHKIINASISGDTTGGGLMRLPQLLTKFSPTHVIIELGANDGLRGYPISIIEDNIKEMIEICRSKAARPILFGMRIPGNYGSRYAEGFANIYTKIATEKHVDLINFDFYEITETQSLIQSDGLHPTASAQPIIKEKVQQFLIKTLGF